MGKESFSKQMSYLLFYGTSKELGKIRNLFETSGKKQTTVNWSNSSNLTDLMPFVDSIIVKESYILVSINVFDLDLLGDYPSESKVQEQRNFNVQANIEARDQQLKDLKSMGIEPLEDMPIFAMPENTRMIKAELKKFRLVDAVYELLEQLVKLSSFKEVNIAFRNKSIGRREEVYACGSSNLGVLACHLNDLSDPNEWFIDT